MNTKDIVLKTSDETAFNAEIAEAQSKHGNSTHAGFACSFSAHSAPRRTLRQKRLAAFSNALSIQKIPAAGRLLVLALMALPWPAAAQNPAGKLAADPNTSMTQDMRANLQTIGQYAQEVSRRATPAGIPAADVAAPANAATATRDPFEVSPQLREGRSYRYSGLPSANVLEVQRRVQVRAVIRSGQNTLAQLFINNKDAITVMDKELIDLADLGTFQVDISGGTVALTDPSNPQGKRVVLR